MPVMSAIYCNFANPIISDAVNVPHVSVEINKRFYYYYYYYYYSNATLEPVSKIIMNFAYISETVNPNKRGMPAATK